LKILNGIDIVAIERFHKIHDKNQELIRELFSPGEIEYCKNKKLPWQSFSARFAAKEAVIKAIDYSVLGVDLSKIEVTNTETGRPEISIHSDVILSRIRNLLGKDEYTINLSISHEKEYSVAHVLIF
jgi:holo-[acyl-carrier protein] synthase